MMNKIKTFWLKSKPYILQYSIAIAIPLLVGVLAATLTRDSMDIYSKLERPFLAPPPIVFPIVWFILYVMMGISSALVFEKRHIATDNGRKAFIYYATSLVLNFLWSIVFFRLEASLLALIILIGLLYSVIKTFIEYIKISPIAAYLQIPYTLWILFAAYLNTAIWLLN